MTIDSLDLREEHLEQASQQLQESLKVCQELIVDLRSKLAANNNEPLDPDESDLAEDGDPSG